MFSWIRALGGLLVVLLFMASACGRGGVLEPEPPGAKVVLRLHFPDAKPSGGSLGSGSLLKPGTINGMLSINRVEAVFYDYGVSMDELGRLGGDEEIWHQLEEYYGTFVGDPEHNFEDRVRYMEGEVRINSKGKGQLEKRGALTVSDIEAKGEFYLTEGLKTALVGLFENETLRYIGSPPENEAAGWYDVFTAYPDMDNVVEINLWYVETAWQ